MREGYNESYNNVLSMIRYNGAVRKLYEEGVETIVDHVSADPEIKISPPLMAPDRLCMVGLAQNLSVSVLFFTPKKYICVYWSSH